MALDYVNSVKVITQSSTISTILHYICLLEHIQIHCLVNLILHEQDQYCTAFPIQGKIYFCVYKGYRMYQSHCRDQRQQTDTGLQLPEFMPVNVINTVYILQHVIHLITMKPRSFIKQFFNSWCYVESVAEQPSCC